LVGRGTCGYITKYRQDYP